MFEDEDWSSIITPRSQKRPKSLLSKRWHYLYEPVRYIAPTRVDRQNLYSFKWSFSDGETLYGYKVKKTWKRLGDYSYTLTITENETGDVAIENGYVKIIQTKNYIFEIKTKTTLTVSEELLLKAFNSVNSSNIVMYNYQFGCAISNSKLYIFRGHTYEFDPALNTITSKASIGENFVCSSIALNDGRILIPGGWEYSHTGISRIYDPTTNSYTTITNRLNGYGEDYHIVKLQDGRICVTGGDAGSSLTAIDIYDPVSNDWTAGLPTMNVGRQFHSSVVLQDGNVLIYGGRDDYQDDPTPTRTYQIFNPTTKTIVYTSEAILPIQTAFSNVFLMSDGKVLVIGGSSTNETLSSDALILTPYAGTFTTHSLGVVTAGFCCTKLSDKDSIVFLSCGPITYSSSLYKLDYPSMNISFLGDLSVPRTGFARMVEMPSGQIVVVGGANTAPIETLNLAAGL